MTLGLQYGVQSASYKGIGLTVLQNNATLLSGGQVYNIPLRKGFSDLVYSNPNGFRDFTACRHARRSLP